MTHLESVAERRERDRRTVRALVRERRRATRAVARVLTDNIELTALEARTHDELVRLKADGPPLYEKLVRVAKLLREIKCDKCEAGASHMCNPGGLHPKAWEAMTVLGREAQA